MSRAVRVTLVANGIFMAMTMIILNFIPDLKCARDTWNWAWYYGALTFSLWITVSVYGLLMAADQRQ